MTIHLSRRRLTSAVVASSLLTLAACGGTAQSASTQQAAEGGERSFTLKIGDLVPLTGILASQGPSGAKAADLAVAEIERALSDRGDDVEVEIEHLDTETNPQAAIAAARRAISDGASCLTGVRASAEALPIGETVSVPQRVPLIAASAVSPDLTGITDQGFVNRVVPSSVLDGALLVELMQEALGEGALLSLAARNDAYGTGLVNAVRDGWEEAGGQVTGDPVLYDPEQANFNSEAAQIVDGDPDGFVIIDFTDSFERVGTALLRTGEFDGSRLFSGPGLGTNELPDGYEAAAALEGSRGVQIGASETSAAAQRFNELYAASDLEPAERENQDVNNFDAVMTCFLAAYAANSGDGEAIRDHLLEVTRAPGEKFTFLELPEALEALAAGDDIDYEGVTGPIDLDDNGDPTAGTWNVWKRVDGVLTIEEQLNR